jgi:hypothetical protein
MSEVTSAPAAAAPAPAPKSVAVVHAEQAISQRKNLLQSFKDQIVLHETLLAQDAAHLERVLADEAKALAAAVAKVV